MRIRVTQVSLGGGAPDMEHVGVVFPAYNEERHVAEAVGAALQLGVGRVVCVNDCSQDSTGRIIDDLAAADARVTAVHHEQNLGKQGAVKHGLAAIVTTDGLRAVAVLDADMQNDPALLPAMAAHIAACDVVIGARSHVGMPPIRRLANRLANFPYRLLAGIPLRDVQSGYRVYAADAAAYLAEHLSVEGRYALEHTSLLLLGRLAACRGRDVVIGEATIPSRYGDAESNIRVIRDNFRLTCATVYHAAALAALRHRSGA